jgi:hypothetical protein
VGDSPIPTEDRDKAKDFLVNHGDLPESFFEPDQERTADLARAVKMENVVNFAGRSKAQARAAITGRFQGAYKSYYEAQAISVRITSVKLADMALNKYWLTAPNAPGGWERLEQVKPLEAVIDYMKEYEEAFLLTKDKKTFTASLRRLWGRVGKEFTAQDLDYSIDWFCFIVGWILRIIALLSMLSGAGMPLGAGALILAATVDYFGALLRIMLVALLTMMNVVVYQHDTIISQAIAYLVMFKEEPGQGDS